MNVKKTLVTAIATTALTTILASTAFAEALTIYSPQGEENVAWIKEQAAAAGHDVDILRAGGGELFSRLEAERNNPQADVVLGMNDTAMARLKAQDMFEAYVPSWAEGLPEAFVGPDGFVHKFWQTPVVIAYDPAKMSGEDAPSSWLDLTNEEYAGKYTLGQTQWGTTQVILSGLLMRFADENGEISDEGWTFMEDFYANAILINSGDERVAAISGGGASMDLHWFGGAINAAGQAGYEPNFINTEGGTPVVAEGIAIMNSTDQMDEAKAFVDWFGSPEFMAAYAMQFGQLPAHPDAIANSPQEVQDNAKLLDPQDIDWDVVGQNLDGWLQRIELEIK